MDHKTTPTLPPTTPTSLLLLILDLHPFSWSLLSEPPPSPAASEHPTILNRAPPTPLSITEFISILLVFLNAHLASRWGNQVVVYGATAGRSQLLCLPPTAGSSKPNPNMYHPFQTLDQRFAESVKGMAREDEMNDRPAIVSALTKALCYINRVVPTSTSGPLANERDTTSSPDRIEPRIMIVNATPSSASGTANVSGTGGGEMRGGYVGLMNCVFAAQKAKVPIDVLTLPPLSGGTAPPIFLQQAAHLTDGVYWRWNGRGGLLQYLHTIYLAPPSLRHTPFAVPPQDAVDFRAVCFCHNNVVDVGFVCSVCLSIFCKPLPVCQMCKTKFPVKTLPTLKALAANISPIPIPNTIPPPSRKTDGMASTQPKSKGKGRRRGEPMQVD